MSSASLMKEEGVKVIFQPTPQPRLLTVYHCQQPIEAILSCGKVWPVKEEKKGREKKEAERGGRKRLGKSSLCCPPSKHTQHSLPTV